jgi:regulator of nucleoside diphosphate kinase
LRRAGSGPERFAPGFSAWRSPKSPPIPELTIHAACWRGLALLLSKKESNMKHEQNTRITDRDAVKLARIVEDLLRRENAIENGAEALHDRLDAARIVPAREIDSDVVTMNSEVAIEDARTGGKQTLRLVYPGEANAGAGRVSVLSPLGNAILGACAGEAVSFETPAGERWIRITGIRFQPEAAGQYDL